MGASANADKLNRMNPTSQELQLGTELYSQTPIIISTAVTAAANSTAASVTIPCAMRILLVMTECTAANGSGTLTLRNGTTAITNAMACSTDKAVAYASSVDDAVSTVAAGDNVNIIANGANDRGVVTIFGIRL